MRLVLLAALCAGAFAAGPADDGFTHFYNLEFEQALEIFAKAAAADPTSPERQNHIAQTVLYAELHRNGALESELVSGNNSFLRRPKLNPSAETERLFLEAIHRSISLSRERLRRDPDDSVALYALGVAYGLRSNYYFLVRKAWTDSLRDATTARRLHHRVTEIEPSNIDARLMQGVHDYVVGSLPRLYRMLGFLIGFRGNKERGIRTLETVAQEGNRNRVDAKVLLCAVYRREEKPKKALPLLAGLIAEYPRNYLLRFEEAGMYSALGEKEKALEVLERIAQLKSRNAPGYARVPWEKLYFHQGNIQFWYNDLEDALENLERVARAAEDLDLNTGVLAWMRVGQIHDMQNRRAMAVEAYERAIAHAPEAEAARESRRYLASPYRREKL